MPAPGPVAADRRPGRDAGDRGERLARRRTRRRPRARRARGGRGGRGRPRSRCRPRPSRTRRRRSPGSPGPRGAGWRAPRSSDGCCPGGGLGSRVEWLKNATIMNPATAMPTHTTRQLAPSSSATPVAIAPITAPPLKRPWKRTRWPGRSASAAAETTFITTSTKPPAAVASVNATANHPSAGAAATPRSSRLQMNSDRGERGAGAPAVGERAADRVDARGEQDAEREHEAEPRVGEAEGALHVDDRDGPRARVAAEHGERRADGKEGGAARAGRRLRSWVRPPPVRRARRRACC